MLSLPSLLLTTSLAIPLQDEETEVEVLPPAYQSAFTLGGGRDVDADGFADFIVGYYEYAINTPELTTKKGFARVYSGRDGSVLHSFEGENSEFGIAVALEGDIDVDGFADIVVGSHALSMNQAEGILPDPKHNLVKVFSGRTGKELYEFRGSDTAYPNSDGFGLSVTNGGDVDHDTLADIVVGAPYTMKKIKGREQRVGSLYAFSGSKGELIYQIEGEKPGAFGTMVRLVGDCNANGKSDIAVTDPDARDGKGRVVILDGKRGEELHEFVGKKEGDRLGAVVNFAGDANQDAFSDFLIGVPGYAKKKGKVTGAIRLVHGKKGRDIVEILGDSPEYPIGYSADGAGDINGDGFDDFIVGGPAKSDGAGDPIVARVFSGHKGKLLLELRVADQGAQLGRVVSGIGDIDMDGMSDIVVAGLWRIPDEKFRYAKACKGPLVVVFSGKDGRVLHVLEDDGTGNLVRTGP